MIEPHDVCYTTTMKSIIKLYIELLSDCSILLETLRLSRLPCKMNRRYTYYSRDDFVNTASFLREDICLRLCCSENFYSYSLGLPIERLEEFVS